MILLPRLWIGRDPRAESEGFVFRPLRIKSLGLELESFLQWPLTTPCCLEFFFP